MERFVHQLVKETPDPGTKSVRASPLGCADAYPSPKATEEWLRPLFSGTNSTRPHETVRVERHVERHLTAGSALFLRILVVRPLVVAAFCMQLRCGRHDWDRRTSSSGVCSSGSVGSESSASGGRAQGRGDRATRHGRGTRYGEPDGCYGARYRSGRFRLERCHRPVVQYRGR